MTPSALAPVAIVTAMLLFAVGDNYVPLLADSMSVWQYHALRAAMILPVMIGAMALVGQVRSIRVHRPGAVLARSGVIIAALMLYFSALPAVGVPLAAAGLFTSPIFVVIYSVLFFGERVGGRRLAAMAVGFLGVCTVLNVWAQPVTVMAAAPMAGGALYALGIIWTRRYCAEESAGALAVWNMALFMVVGSVGVLMTPALAGALAGIEGTGFITAPPSWPEGWQFGLIAAIGASAAIGMALLAWGYRSADSSYAALFDYSFLVWAPLFAWLIQGEVIPLRMAIGMGLILLAGALTLGSVQKKCKNARSGQSSLITVL